jgi:hypothetical protein
MLAMDPALPAHLEAEEDEDTLEDWEEMITSILVSILLNFYRVCLPGTNTCLD